MDKGHLKQYVIGLAVAVTLFASCGMAYGWSAPVLVRLLSNESEIPMTQDEGAYVVAAIEFGNLFTPIPAGYIADRLGRKPLILSIVPLLIVGWALVIFTRTYEILILARIIMGMAMGIIFTISPLYLSEITEPEIRGKVNAMCSVFWFLGILASYSIGPFVSYSTFSCVAVSLPTIAGLGLIFIPESPYVLVARRKYESAEKALRRIRRSSDAAIVREAKSIKGAVDQTKLTCTALVADPCCRRSFLLNLLIGFVGLFGGVTVMYAYATDIFRSVDGIPLNADGCTIALGCIYCVLCVITTGIVDVCGRRPLFLISVGGAGVCHFIGGLYFYLLDNTDVHISGHGWILLLAVGGYCVFNSIGMLPLTPVYQGEIFPDGIKGIASGLSILEQCTLSMTALKLFQVVNSNFGRHVSFWFFSLVNVFGFILMYFFLIETKGKTLAEIQMEFKAGTKKKPHHSEIDVTETIPFKIDS